MICKACRNTGTNNRTQFNRPGKPPQYSHPTDCGCACQHRPAEEWEKQFSVWEPVRPAKKTKIEDLKPL